MPNEIRAVLLTKIKSNSTGGSEFASLKLELIKGDPCSSEEDESFHLERVFVHGKGRSLDNEQLITQKADNLSKFLQVPLIKDFK